MHTINFNDFITPASSSLTHKKYTITIHHTPAKDLYTDQPTIDHPYTHIHIVHGQLQKACHLYLIDNRAKLN